jgi:hypothetical protein
MQFGDTAECNSALQGLAPAKSPEDEDDWRGVERDE